MPERLECEVLQKARYINTLTFTFLPLPVSTTFKLGKYTSIVYTFLKKICIECYLIAFTRIGALPHFALFCIMLC